MADFLDEVIEDVKQENFRRILEKYGNYLVGLILLVVLSTGLGVWYKNHHKKQIISSGNLFYEASNIAGTGERSQVSQLLDNIVEDGGDGYRSLALLQKATILENAGDYRQASDIYKEIGNSAASEEIADMALLHFSYIGMEHPEQSSVKKEELNSILENLSKLGRPWRFSAMELQGIIALRENNIDKARKIFITLREDALSPRSAKDRAGIMLDSLQ